jgi:tRNA threonylcarbamoyladenosine biosynthesis protein TsaB
MLLLGLETSTARCSVALVEDDRVLASAALGVARRHGEFLAPAIRFCLQQASVDVGRIAGVAVGVGPGLFTGLRVGIATAQTFAAALQLPVVGLSGLDVLALQARYTTRPICAAIDARRGELFWAFYRAVPGGVQREGELCLGRADQLAAEIEANGDEVLVVGDGALSYRERLQATGAELAGPDIAWPDAADLAELALPRFLREETLRPERLAPVYLRQADVQIGWAQRGALRGGVRPAADGQAGEPGEPGAVGDSGVGA